MPFTAGGLFYVQALTTDLAGRPAVQVGTEWIAQMTAAIAVDPHTPLTVGMPNALGVPAEAVQQMLTQIPPRLLPLLGQWRGGPQPVVAPDRPNAELDLYCLHSYPHTGAADQTIDEIRAWAAHGNPLVVEETFPLHCTIPGWLDYAHAADPDTAGWLTFYWGTTRRPEPEGRRRPHPQPHSPHSIKTAAGSRTDQANTMQPGSSGMELKDRHPDIGRRVRPAENRHHAMSLKVVITAKAPSIRTNRVSASVPAPEHRFVFVRMVWHWRVRA